MEHLYSALELAKITLFVDNTIEENSFSARKYAKGIYLEEDNDENDTYFTSIQRIQEALSDKFRYYKETFEFNFKYEKNSRQYQLNRFEVLVLVFFLIYPSDNQTLISKIKNKKQYSFSEIISFYNELSSFLKNNKFQKDGIWYDFEKELIGTEPISLSNEEINLKIKKMQNVTILKYLKEKIRAKAIEAIDYGLDELIPDEIISKIPLITQLEHYKQGQTLDNEILTVEDAEKIYSKNEIESLTSEDLKNENLKIDSFIHSGHFAGNTYDFTICSLIEFYNGIYDDENNSMYNKILKIFKYLDCDIIEGDLAAVTKADYDSLIKEMMEKSEQEE